VVEAVIVIARKTMAALLREGRTDARRAPSPEKTELATKIAKTTSHGVCVRAGIPRNACGTPNETSASKTIASAPPAAPLRHDLDGVALASAAPDNDAPRTWATYGQPIDLERKEPRQLHDEEERAEHGKCARCHTETSPR
jgi:hypothetical protein